MATTLENLVVKISADTAQIQRSMDRLERQTADSSRRMERAFVGPQRGADRLGQVVNTLRVGMAALAVAIATRLVTAIGGAAREAAAYGATIDDVASKVGLTTDALQELRFAAEQSGVAASALDMSMQRFSRRVGEAAQGTGALLPTLQQYDIALRNADGSTRSLEDILGDLADATLEAESSQEQLRISVAAFDSEGAGLVNMLRDGRAGLDELRQAARDAGAVIDADLIATAADADDKLAALGTTLDVQLKSVLLELAPIITGAGDALVWLAQRGREATVAIAAAGEQAATTWIETNRQISDTFARLQDQTPMGAISDWLFGGDAPGVDDVLPEWMQSPLSGNNLEGIPLPDGRPLWDQARERAAGDAEAMRTLLERAEQAIDIHRRELATADNVDWAANVRQMLADMIATRDAIRADMDRLTGDVGTPPPPGGGGGGGGRRQDDRLAEILRGDAEALDAFNDRMRDATALVEAHRTPLEIYNDRLAALRDLYPQLVVAAGGAAQAQAIVNAEMVAAAEDLEEASAEVDLAAELWSDFGDAAASALGRAIEGGDNLRSVLAGLITDMLRMESVQKGIGQLFDSLFGGGSLDLGGLFGGGDAVPKIHKFAEGGDPPLNVPSIVGEEGPELIVPRQPMTVIPNHMLGGQGGGSTVTVNQFIDARGAQLGVEQRIQVAMRQAKNEAKAELLAEINAGGSAAKITGRRSH